MLSGLGHRVAVRSRYIVGRSGQTVVNYGFDFRRSNDEEHELEQRRSFHVTTRKDNSSVIIGALSVGAMGMGVATLVEQYAKRKQTQEATKKVEDNDKSKAGKKQQQEEEEPGFFSWFSFSLGKTFYKGGFEPEMTRREAALILGIRESSSRDKVKEAHRRLALLNHPDTGGSTYVATKINQAKDKLLGAA